MLLSQLTNLLENVNRLGKFAIVFNHQGDLWHKLDPSDLWPQVFTDEKSFCKYIGELYEDHMDDPDDEGVELHDLHDDDDVKDYIRSQIPERKHPSEMNWTELQNLDRWSNFTDYVTIFYRLFIQCNSRSRSGQSRKNSQRSHCTLSFMGYA